MTEEKADQLWHQVVVLRAHRKCEICGQPAEHSHHLIPKDHCPMLFWYNTYFGALLCSKCQQLADGLPFDKFIGKYYLPRLALLPHLSDKYSSVDSLFKLISTNPKETIDIRGVIDDLRGQIIFLEAATIL